jgi:hypothetical protein
VCVCVYVCWRYIRMCLAYYHRFYVPVTPCAAIVHVINFRSPCIFQNPCGGCHINRQPAHGATANTDALAGAIVILCDSMAGNRFQFLSALPTGLYLQVRADRILPLMIFFSYVHLPGISNRRSLGSLPSDYQITVGV